MTTRDVHAMQAAESVKRIAFESAEVVSGFPGHFLIVRGEAPCVNMVVWLSPLIYIDCPDYWGIEVVGSLPGGVCLTATKPFALTIPLTGITGYKGVEVLGSNRSETFDVSGGCEQDSSLG